MFMQKATKMIVGDTRRGLIWFWSFKTPELSRRTQQLRQWQSHHVHMWAGALLLLQSHVSASHAPFRGSVGLISGEQVPLDKLLGDLRVQSVRCLVLFSTETEAEEATDDERQLRDPLCRWRERERTCRPVFKMHGKYVLQLLYAGKYPLKVNYLRDSNTQNVAL